MVYMTDGASEEYDRLEVDIEALVLDVFRRLERWPEVSGVDPLHGPWSGHQKIRTGDWRVIFKLEGGHILVVKIGHRSKVYGG